MLTRYDFNGFTEYQKANEVLQGTFLADRWEEGLTVQLYSVGSFYVEVFMSRFEYNLKISFVYNEKFAGAVSGTD